MKSLKDFIAESNTGFAFNYKNKDKTEYHITGTPFKLRPSIEKEGYKAHYVLSKRNNGVKQDSVILHKNGKILSHHSLGVQAEQAADIHNRTGKVPQAIQDAHNYDSVAHAAIIAHIKKHYK